MPRYNRIKRWGRSHLGAVSRERLQELILPEDGSKPAPSDTEAVSARPQLRITRTADVYKLDLESAEHILDNLWVRDYLGTIRAAGAKVTQIRTADTALLLTFKDPKNKFDIGVAQVTEEGMSQGKFDIIRKLKNNDLQRAVEAALQVPTEPKARHPHGKLIEPSR